MGRTMTHHRALAVLGTAFVVTTQVYAKAAELPPERCVRLLREARLAGQRGGPARQVEILKKAVAEFPGELLPILSLLDATRREGLGPEETADLKRILRERIAKADSLVPDSVLELAVEDPDASPEDLAMLRAAVASRLARIPDDAALLEVHAALSERLLDLDAARDSAARLDAAKPDPSTLTWRIRLATKAKKWDETASLCREFRSRYEDSPDLRVRAAGALVAAGRRQEAREEIAPVLADPKVRSWAIDEFLVPLGWELWDAGRAAEARAVFEEAADAAPEEGQPEAILRNLFATPEQREALAAEKASSLARIEDPNILFSQATDFLTTGDVERAYAVLRRVVTLDATFEMAWFNLGVSAWRLEKWDEAREAFQKSGSLKPNRAESFLFLGESLRKLNRCEEALPAFRHAVELRPDLREAHAGLAACLRRMGRHDAAAREDAAARPPG